MKKFFASLFILFACALCVALAACGGGGSNKVTLSFNSNGGSEVSSVQVTEGEMYTLPIPTKTDYEFDGWFDNPELNGQAFTEVKATSSKTYYAKWAKLYTVNLNADGGTLPSNLTASFKLKAGGNLFTALKDYVPTKGADYKFDAWMNGSTRVTANTRMPESDVTLKAGYNIKYTLEVYRQNIENEEFTKDENDIVNYGAVGSTVYPEPDRQSMTGFTIDEDHDGSKLEGTLSATVSENVFTVYLLRNSYTVTFYANYPDGTSRAVSDKTAKYGASVDLPDNLDYAGYRLIGWAYTQSGSVAYTVDSISNRLYNSTAGYKKSSFTIEDNIALYAVWEGGYTDMFGGSNAIFLMDGTTDAYLNCNGVYFKGAYDKAKDSVTITNGEAKGEYKLFADKTFAYNDTTRHAEKYYLYELSTEEGNLQASVKEDTYLTFDGYNGVTYTSASGNSTGTFTINSQGYYVCNFTQGALSGEKTVLLSQTLTGGEAKYIFRIRDDAEYELGALCRGVLMGGALSYYDAPVYSLVFTGFHSAILYVSESEYYMCLCDVDIAKNTFKLYTLSDTGDSEFMFEGRITDIADATSTEMQKCYFIYSEDYDITATGGSDSLKLDGCVNATYTENGKAVNGYFSLADTGFGESLVTLYVDGSEYADFILKKSTGDNYTFEKKAIGYAEFNYSEGSLIYSDIFLVLNDSGKDTAALYYRTAEGTLTKISSGTFKQDGNTYIYTKSGNITVPSNANLPFLTDFTGFVFTLTTKSSVGDSYFVNIWTEYSKDTATTELYKKKYTADNGETLALLNSDDVAIYTYKDNSEDVTLVGNYVLLDYAPVIRFTIGVDSYLFFAIDDNGSSFSTLQAEPYLAYKANPDFTIDENEWLVCTGKSVSGGLEGIYNVKKGDDTTQTKGVISTNHIAQETTFTPDSGEGAFKFMMFLNSETNISFISIYNEKYEGSFVSADGVLTLDGYGSAATLNGVTSRYIVRDENVVVILASDGYIYIDLKDNNTFTRRDSAYGNYLLVNNNTLNGWRLSFDGYGKLEVYDENDALKDGNGSYEVTENGAKISFSTGTTDITDREGSFGRVTVGGLTYNAFSFTYDNITDTKYEGRYVDTSDSSVVQLSGSGSAVKYFPNGRYYSCSYEIVTDNLLYLVSADGSVAGVYKYDTQNCTLTPVTGEAVRYFSADMKKEIVLSSRGYAFVEGDERAYYVIENNNIYLYLRGEVGTGKYGFKEKTLLCATTAETFQYNNTQYTKDSAQLVFTRNGSDSKYPVKVDGEGTAQKVEKIAFTPADGAASYTVAGKITIASTEYDCTVSSYLSDGNVTYYIIYGNYRLSVSLSHGTEKTFTVTALEEVQTAYAQQFVSNYRLSDMFLGAVGENGVGMLQLFRTYNESGAAKDEWHVTASFGTLSLLYDTDSNLLSIDYAECTFADGVYTVAFTGEDDYDYEFAFTLADDTGLNVKSFTINYVTRTENLTSGTYNLEAHVLIGSDVLSQDLVGVVYSAKLKNSDTEIPCSDIFIAESGIYYVSRPMAESKITDTKYYKIDLTLHQYTDEEIAEGLTLLVVPTYESAEISELANIKTYYSEDGNAYADVDTENHTVLAIFIDGVGSRATQSTKEVSGDKYLVCLSSGVAYSVEIKGENITLTKVALVADRA